MPLRFRKSVRAFPGLKFNVNRKSVGITIGGHGIHTTFNSRGRRTTSVGIPGSGLYYTHSQSTKRTHTPSTANAVAGNTSVVGVVLQDAAPPLLVRALYFLAFGAWAGAAAMALAWLCVASGVWAPWGAKLLRGIPRIMTLQTPRQYVVGTLTGSTLSATPTARAQRPLLVRMLYFVAVGWWASIAVFLLAWVLAACTLGLAVGIVGRILDRIPLVTTLARY